MPTTGKENVFDALFKWGDSKSKEEDFYSKSLILVLQRLKRDNQEMATDFVNSLFPLHCELVRPGTEWDIIGQIGKDHRLDILLEAADMLAYVEVKWGSKPNKKQLRDYRDELLDRIQKKNIKWNEDKPPLFLLTKFGVDKDWGIPYKEVSWVDTCLILGNIKGKLEKGLPDNNLMPEAYFLVRDFYEFLRRNGMGIEKVQKIVEPDNLIDLRKYLFVIQTGCTKAKLRGAAPGIPEDEDWIGWWFKEKTGKEKKHWKEKQYWCGFYLQEPSQIGFGLTDEVYKIFKNRITGKRDLEQILSKFTWEDYKDNKCAEFFFGLPAGFLDLSVGHQVESIAEFIKDVLHTALGREIEAE